MGETLHLEVRRLVAGYGDAGGTNVEVSFELAYGERLVLLGPNGAGKTTLLLGLLGLIPSQGEIVFGGKAIDPSKSESIKTLREACGLLFQNPDEQMFMPTVIEDVAFTPIQQGVPIEDAISQARDILERIGIAHLAEKPPRQLSLGEKRLVAIAGIIAAQPEIILLDEPTSSLDPHATGEIARLLDSLPQSMIITTHNIEFAKHVASRALVMNRGRIVAMGKVEELVLDTRLMEQNHLIARYE